MELADVIMPVVILSVAYLLLFTIVHSRGSEKA
jgi:hypothetical protein